MTSSLLVLMGDWKSMQQSPILQLLRAFSPAYKGEGDLQSSGCVAFFWWTPYTGFKLFCLGYWETEFIWQPQESGPHLIACDETRPPVAGRNPAGCRRGGRAVFFCQCPCKLLIDFHGTARSVWANELQSPFSKVPVGWKCLKLRIKLLSVSSESLPRYWVLNLPGGQLFLSQYIRAQLICSNCLLTFRNKNLFLNVFEPKLPVTVHRKVLLNGSLSECLLLHNYRFCNADLYKLSMFYYS